MENTTKEFVSNKSVCLVDSHAECHRLWVSQADGLHPSYFQTEPILVGRESDLAASGDPNFRIVHSVACQQCARHNCSITAPLAA